ncbi:hypothetical protein RCL_jg28032.t1 [Rhizophagus clarus]|uniref:Uncharacterized protein n=1 Tax=Rhizophagus clarus TaxID=94130 RepID=A0A8H3R0D6_9GLOM|nr:hypothetical protein RCL_jg28032.t1 [Rhizophagus clarus]
MKCSNDILRTKCLHRIFNTRKVAWIKPIPPTFFLNLTETEICLSQRWTYSKERSIVDSICVTIDFYTFELIDRLYFKLYSDLKKANRKMEGMWNSSCNIST